MRKILLSFFVIGSFGLYLIYSKPETIWNYGTTREEALPEVSPSEKFTYRDGEYTGNSADAYYGYIKVKAVIKDSSIMDVVFLDSPHDRDTSIMINDYAMPILKTEAIQIQNSEVDIVSGATDSSRAFRESLAEALKQAKI